MEKKRYLRLISFLLLAFLVFQLIPSDLNSIGTFQSHSQASEVVPSSNLLDHNILFVSKESHKALLQRISNTISTINTSLIFVYDVYLVDFFFEKEPFDYRTVIRQSILHYFNGGKYK